MNNNTNQQQRTMPALRNGFDPSRHYNAYNITEWKVKEDWYYKVIDTLKFQAIPTPVQVQEMALRIDAVLTIAEFDRASIRQNADRYNTILKYEQKRAYNTMKTSLMSSGGKGPTVGEIESAVANMLQTTPYMNTGLSLIDLVIEANSRSTYMDGVVDTIIKKKDDLITHTGILKLENSLSAMQSNAPRG